MSNRICVIVGANAMLIAATACGPNAPPAPPPLTAEQRFQQEAEHRVGLILKDPSSAQFEWAFTLPARDMGCGKVNSKNSFGGYAGFDNFCQIRGVTYLASADIKSYAAALREMTKTINDVSLKKISDSTALETDTKARLRNRIEATR